MIHWTLGGNTKISTYMSDQPFWFTERQDITSENVVQGSTFDLLSLPPCPSCSPLSDTASHALLISTFAQKKNRPRTCWLAARATKEKIQGGDNLRLRPRLDGRELAKEPQQQAGSLSLQPRPQYTWMSTAKGKTRAGSLSVSQSAKSILEI